MRKSLIELINHTQHSETAKQGCYTSPQHPGCNAPYLAEMIDFNVEKNTSDLKTSTVPTYPTPGAREFTGFVACLMCIS